MNSTNLDKSTNEKIAIQLSNLVKRFGDVTAVNNISLKIRDNEFFSLLGPSGCGKTTTLRMIAGFDMPTSGTIEINGQVQGYLPSYKRPVNTVFQNYALFPHMTIYKNVSFGLEMKKVPKEELHRRVMEILELVHLQGMEHRHPKQLSGGQQQRVALARALVNHPQVLLLDEPLGALDLKLRKAMQVELKTIQEEVGITFIYVTHDQEEALTMSDRIAVMNEGKVLQVGTPQEIYEQPTKRFVADFIGETNFILGVVAGINDRITVDVAGTEIQANWFDDQISIRDNVVISIRPEKIFLTRADNEVEHLGAARSTLVGKIANIIYLGTDTRYLVDLKNGAQIAVREQNSDDQEIGFSIEDEVKVNWNMANARVLKE